MQPMKEREPRTDVQLPARLRGGDSWTDVCIQNVSSHGMMLLITNPPERGTYIEVRRGSAVIVGRVMWVRGSRCGLRTRERISVAELTLANAPLGTEPVADRRAQARCHHPGDAAARSVAAGRLMQFAATIALILAAGGLIAHTTYGVLAKPTAVISRALD